MKANQAMCATQATMDLVRLLLHIWLRCTTVLKILLVTGTARVDCLAVTSNTTAVDYTDRVVKALGISFVVA
jgi:hypothetical protein